jgi:lysozyme family protein
VNQAQAIALLIVIEGGYVNNPSDPGGKTKYGITQRTLTSLLPKFHGFPPNVEALTEDQASLIYQTIQWRDIGGDQLSPALACCVLNSAVNQGTPTAVEILQSVAGCDADGVLGPATLRAVAAWKSAYYPGQHIAEEFCAHAAVRYAQLYAKEGQFALGWYRRLFRVYTASVL